MPLRHIVSWRLAAGPVRARLAAEIRERLLTLPSQVPEIRSYEVGVDDEAAADGFDVVLVAEFDDRQALARYAAHPAHQAVAEFIRSAAEARSAVNYRV
ncbi:MAG TPA: Dabb family protein [Microbacteriaceae bacterium]|nr:Dabb family protein [Microbacteriaceae bacterium]